MPNTAYSDWARSVRLLAADMADKAANMEGTELEEEDPFYFNELLSLRDQARRLREQLEDMSAYVLNCNREPAVPFGYRLLDREPRIGEQVQPRWLEKTLSGERAGFLAIPSQVCKVVKTAKGMSVYLSSSGGDTPYTWNEDRGRFMLENDFKVDLLIKENQDAGFHETRT